MLRMERMIQNAFGVTRANPSSPPNPRLLLLLFSLVSATIEAQVPRPANRDVYLDGSGVIRWRDDRKEIALFGANYVLPTASDYRAAGYVGADRKRMIDDDMAHFARMGWDGIRLAFWGDWEAADSAGNLLLNDHLDLLDYLIAQARQRGIYMLFSPIQLYSSNWPDALERESSVPGFGRVFGKGRMGTDPAALKSQVNYLRQILDHVNPYTGVALKNEPAILFIELVNEPWHHPDDLPGSIAYINALTDAVRSTGCRKLVFYNVSQDFGIGEAIRNSKAQGVTFGWYPTGLNSGFELAGNYLRTIDAYPDMLRKELSRLPRIVYEFDSPDLATGYLYPAMARTFRSVGAQFAAMFSYDMLATASRNLGWQTHYLNLVYTPRKALSSVIAAEAMRRLPRLRAYGSYPGNTRFGDFRVSYDENLAELVARDAFLYTSSTSSTPPELSLVTRIAGTGSSPLVRYEGTGAYFLDKVHEGLWRLEVYPDAVPVHDPFAAPDIEKIVTRAIVRTWPISVHLPDLGDSFSAQRVTPGGQHNPQVSAGTFPVQPGVYVLSGSGPVRRYQLPKFIGAMAFAEFHPPPPDTLPLSVQSLAGREALTGRDAGLSVRIVETVPPDSAVLFFRRTASDWYHPYRMRDAGGYTWTGVIPAANLAEGPAEFVVGVFHGNRVATYPDGIQRLPSSWDYYGRSSYRVNIVSPRAPLLLFDPGSEAGRLAFTRIGDAGRRGLFRLGFSPVNGLPVFHVELPVDPSGWSPPDYTASLVIREAILSRGETIKDASAIRIRLRGVGPRQVLHLTLMEVDGTSWTVPVEVDSGWAERTIPLSALRTGHGVLLPQGFPGQWSYWVGPASGRGGPDDRIKPGEIERLQLSLRREEGVKPRAGEWGVEVEWVRLEFGRDRDSQDRRP